MAPDKMKRFSAFILGNGSLCIQCIRLLLESGHLVHGIATSDKGVERWTKDQGIPCLILTEDANYDRQILEKYLAPQSVDYLFSIDNSLILTDEILRLPKSLSINYHDAPLPKYAGLNATTWAISNGEKTHGISWHVIDNAVDTGDILKQTCIQISEHETALTLNAKCYDSAIDSFREIIHELSSNSVVRVCQNLDKRSYYSSNSQPIPACIVNWNQPAESLVTLVRSLDFGFYANPIGVAKIQLDKIFVVPKIVINTQTKSQLLPGTIVALSNEQIVVATASTDLAIQQFYSLGGEHLSLADLAEQFGLCKGYKLSNVNTTFLDKIIESQTSFHRHEKFWIQQLSRLKLAQLPYAKKVDTTHRSKRFTLCTIKIPNLILELLHAGKHNNTIKESLLYFYVLYLVRLTGNSNFHLAYQSEELRQRINEQEINTIYSSHIPLEIEVNDHSTLQVGIEVITQQIKICKKHKTFALDATARYPESSSHDSILETLRIAVDINDIAEESELSDYYDGADLTIKLFGTEASKNGTKMDWIFNQESYELQNVEYMQHQFLQLVKYGLENPQCKISELPLLSKADLNQILIQFNTKHGDIQHNQAFHKLFEYQAIRVPDCTALIFDTQQITYRELNQRANNLAGVLHKTGVGPESLVGLFISRSVEMIVSILAIMKSGGAYVPLNIDDPKDRLAFILEDAQLDLLITQTFLQTSLPDTPVQKLFIDSDWNCAGSVTNYRYDTDLQPDNLAYVIYTSGTTGTPKGVMMSHRSLVNRFLWELDVFKRNENDRVLQQFSISFDYSVWEIFIALTSGACLVLARSNDSTDSSYLTHLIHKHSITIAGFVPAMLESLIHSKKFNELQSLRQICSGGEELTLKLLKEYFKNLKAPLLNGYGPTEACIDATWWTCQVDYHEDSVIPIGVPLANASVYILDKHLHPVPIGVPGELYISGVCLARGYLNRPVLTKEVFVPDPFSETPGSRMYKTGDMGRYLPDGNIVFLGRVDSQVKTRGFRIELGEIESAIRHHLDVRQTVVLAIENKNQKQLVAYITLNEGVNLLNRDLRNWLRKKLPSYMIPSAFILMEQLPTLANGKLDRSNLPRPSKRDRILEETLVRPQDEFENQLLQIWENVFEFSPIGVEDNFFEIGGHSLMAEQIFAQIEEQFGSRWPLATLFQAPTIALLGKYIRDSSIS